MATLSLLAEAQTHIQFPGMSPKWAIGSLALFHTAVASLSIGFAFVVTVLQVLGYRLRHRGYDRLAKRIQLYHVCIYNIGTINAIGLVFVLGGLYPEFWSQLFVHMFWPMILEELCFFLLATTLTLHYFFWDHLWGHKKLHIFLGALLTPLFLLQFYYINGMGAFLLTPGIGQGQLTQWAGTRNILGYDKTIFYNPSFLMLTFHRALANFSYGAFTVAGICGLGLYWAKRPKIRGYYETGARAAFYTGFAALLGLPIIGYFYAHVLKYHAHEAYVNLMWGKGDIVAGGVDWWWIKHLIVPAMIGLGLAYAHFHRLSPIKVRPEPEGPEEEEPRPEVPELKFSLPGMLIWTVAGFYTLFYLAMGMIMTWLFFWASLFTAVGAVLVGRHLLRYHEGSGRALYVMVGILSFATIMLGGYVREAARPRFTGRDGAVSAEPQENRYSNYDDIYIEPERQKAPGPMRLLTTMPDYARAALVGPLQPATPPDLITLRCVNCHSLQRVRQYRHDDWNRVVWRMQRYDPGLLTPDEARTIISHLESGEHY